MSCLSGLRVFVSIKTAKRKLEVVGESCREEAQIIRLADHEPIALGYLWVKIRLSFLLRVKWYHRRIHALGLFPCLGLPSSSIKLMDFRSFKHAVILVDLSSPMISYSRYLVRVETFDIASLPYQLFWSPPRLHSIEAGDSQRRFLID